MGDAALDTLIGFVEGRLSAAKFERAVQDDPEIETLLSSDPDLPPRTYVGSGVHLFLLQLDLADPGAVLSAQGAVSDWLRRHSIAHSRSKEPWKLYDLLLAAQPEWLDVDAKWLQTELVEKAGSLKGEALKKWLRAELPRRFRYVPKPPEWIQSPRWPIGAHGPLVFLGQVTIRDYFHDEAAAYVFHDSSSGACKTIIQVA